LLLIGEALFERDEEGVATERGEASTNRGVLDLRAVEIISCTEEIAFPIPLAWFLGVANLIRLSERSFFVSVQASKLELFVKFEAGR
jgi:hypothetical protein